MRCRLSGRIAPDHRGGAARGRRCTQRQMVRICGDKKYFVGSGEPDISHLSGPSDNNASLPNRNLKVLGPWFESTASVSDDLAATKGCAECTYGPTSICTLAH